MEKNKPTKEKILKAKYANDKWEPTFKNILEVMQEYADLYHKEKLKGDLKAFNNFVWKLEEEEDKIPLFDYCIDGFIKRI